MPAVRESPQLMSPQSQKSSSQSIRDMNEEDKLALWMPKGMATPKNPSRSNSLASSGHHSVG